MPQPTTGKRRTFIPTGTAVSWLSLQGVKVFGVVRYSYDNGTCRVLLPSGTTLSIRTDRLTVEK